MITDQGYYTHKDKERNIPSVLKRLAKWCCMQLTFNPKKSKHDKYPCDRNGNGMTKVGIANLSTTYDEYHTTLRIDGIPDDDGKVLIFIDGDAYPIDQHGEWYDDFYSKIRKETYFEKSLSAELDAGKINWHALGYVSTDTLKHHPHKTKYPVLGIEVYSKDRWCLMTGLAPADRVVADIDDLYKELVTYGATTLPKKKTKPTPTPKPKPKHTVDTGDAHTINVKYDGLRISKRDVNRVVLRLKWHMHYRNTHPLCKDYNTFLRVVHSLKSMGFSDNVIIKFCKHQPGYDAKAFADILNISTPGDIQLDNFFALSNEAGCSDDLALELSRVSTESTEPKSVEETAITLAQSYTIAKESVNINQRKLDVAELADVGHAPNRNTWHAKTKLQDWIAPIGKLVVLCGEEHVGKTSLVYHWLAKASHHHRIVHLSYDIEKVLLRPTMNVYGINEDNWWIFDRNIDERFGVSCLDINVMHKLFIHLKPQIVFIDSIERLLFDKNPSLTPADTKAMADAVFELIDLIAWSNISAIGTIHPSTTNPHMLPFSARWHGIPYRVDFLYSNTKSISAQGFSHAWVLNKLTTESEETRVLINKRHHGKRQLPVYMYDYANEPDSSLLHPDDTFIPGLISNWREVTRPSRNKKGTPDTSQFTHVNDVYDLIHELAKGIGEKFSVGESRVIRAMYADPRQSRKADDYELRRDLYAKAKASPYVGFKGSSNKGFTVWLTEAYNQLIPSINATDYDSHGGQDD